MADRAEAPEDARATSTLTQEGARHHATVQRFRLLVVAGKDEGTALRSSGERVVVGTHESADLVLSDDTVSRFHCEIEVTEGRVRVRDLGSRNGTRINGVSVVEGHAEPGAILQLGRTEIRFELRGEAVQIPLSERDRFGNMVGSSAAMRRAFALLERAAPTDATVLLEGETGTGKEVAAESIHLESERRDGPFIVIDCGAIPADLLESELFGHERGSFTGATTAREGAFEAAGGGTIFLDEIGELALDLQPKLLRALERKQVKRVGGNKYLPVDVRVVAATNRNLREEVNAHRFRADLYYRIAVVEVRLPALRERMEDVPALVEHLLGTLGKRDRPRAQALVTPAFVAELSAHRWPGNVRELRNYLERCVALRTQLPLEAQQGATADPCDTQLPLKAARERWERVCERRYLEAVLSRAGGNVAAAARAAEVDRMHFYRLLWRHGLR